MLMQNGYQGSINDVQGARELQAPLHVMGDRRAAKAVCRSPSALIAIGDSRLYNLRQTVFAANAVRFPLAGANVGVIGSGNAFFAETIYTQQPHAPVVTPWGDLGAISPWDLIAWTLNGSVTGINDQLSQYCYGAFASGLYDRPQLQGKNVTFYFWVLEQPNGVASDDLQLVIDVPGVTTYRSAYFSNRSAQTRVVVRSLVVPNTHDWATNPTVYAKIVHRWNTATVNGNVVALAGVCARSEIGCAIWNVSVGGRSTNDFTNRRIFSPALYDSFAQMGSGFAMLMDLGTNGPAYAADFTAKQLLIDDFRAKFGSSAPIVLGTAYQSGASYVAPSSSNDLRDACLSALAEEPELSMMVDTHFALPPAAQAISGDGLSAPYYTAPDYIHYNAVGFAAHARTLLGGISDFACET